MIYIRDPRPLGRILLILVVVLLTCGLTATGHDVATAVVLSAAMLGVGVELAGRALPRREAP